MKKVFTSLCLAALSLVASSRADDAVTLRWAREAGQTLRYRMVQEQQQIHSALRPGQDTVRQTILLREDTQRVDRDGLAILGIKIESIKMEYDTLTGKWTYDSENPADKEKRSIPMFMPAVLMAGATFGLSIKPDGNVLSVTGFEEHLADLIATPNDLPYAAAIAQQAKKLFSNESMKQTFETSHHVLPTAPVKPGDSWPRQITLAMTTGNIMAEDGTFTLTGVEERNGEQVARIAFKARLEMKPAGPYNQPARVEMKDSTAEGEILFSITRGALLSSTQQVILNVANVYSGPAPGDTNAVPKETRSEQTMKHRITMELVEETE